MTAEVAAVVVVVAVITAWVAVWRRATARIRARVTTGWLPQLVGAMAGVVAAFAMFCLLAGLLVPGEGSGVVAVLGLLILAPFSLLFFSRLRRVEPTELPLPEDEDGHEARRSSEVSEDEAHADTEPRGLAEGRELVAVGFDYANEDGEISRRHVLLRSNRRSGDRLYIEGVDLGRQALRTFRLDRIIGMVARVSDDHLLSAEDVYASLATTKTGDVKPAVGRAATRAKAWETAVFFAGFGPLKRAELESLAEAAGWQVRSRITGTVDYVVAGAMAGSAQLASAEQNGAVVIDEDGFLAMF